VAKEIEERPRRQLGEVAGENPAGTFQRMKIL